MELKAKTFNPVTHKSDCLVLVVPASGELGPSASAVDEACEGLLTRARKEGELNEFLDTLCCYAPRGLQAKRLLVVGSGDKSLDPAAFGKLAGRIAGRLKDMPVGSGAVCLDNLCAEDRTPGWGARELARKVCESLYVFDAFKSGKKKERARLKRLDLRASGAGEATLFSEALDQGRAIAGGVNLARELGDTPANHCTPAQLATRARQLARKSPKLTARVLNEQQMKELKMGSLLSVTTGTDTPAKMIVLEYKGGRKNDKPVALVGKGVTFDSGGISLKPAAAMDEMKYDMCGAASVFGTIAAAMEMELPVNVVGVVPAVENMPGSGATKPGDIVTSMSGQTIEVLNTDAEGRLILCDALTYTERYKPDAVVDIATLTGACVVALGSHATGLFSNDDNLATALLECGENAGDRAWRLPLWSDYDEQLKSNFADMANIGGKGAGSITAACFLGRFTRKYTWAHLDIAGTAWNSGANKGATGRPVALLTEYLIRRAS